MSAPNKSVRFSSESLPLSRDPSAEENEKGSKRNRGNKSNSSSNSNDEEEDPSWRKKQKKSRPNQDELDDVDDWQQEDDDDEVPEDSYKGKRRKNNADADADDDDMEESTTINDKTSLASEGIKVEPFHMRQEQSDGTGFFDGDTYVFRKRNADEEPDAWLESLNEGNAAADDNEDDNDKGKGNSSVDSEDEEEDVPARSKEEWYAKLLHLVSDTETIMQAVIRYGALLKRQPRTKQKKNHHTSSNTQTQKQSQIIVSEAFQLAQASLNDLTEAANALLGLGDVDIYQKTRNDLLKMVPPPPTPPPPKDETSSNNTVSWEYKGSQDDKIHGPYTSQQMRAWTQAGYFLGSQAVQIRSIQLAKPKDDLLSDLLEDDDDDNGDGTVVRGQWVSSDSVDFGASL
jgi:CD2 antigen cytoplasmic tail-binding protein 2